MCFTGEEVDDDDDDEEEDEPLISFSSSCGPPGDNGKSFLVTKTYMGYIYIYKIRYDDEKKKNHIQILLNSFRRLPLLPIQKMLQKHHFLRGRRFEEVDIITMVIKFKEG